jgi:hypothetical protein
MLVEIVITHLGGVSIKAKADSQVINSKRTNLKITLYLTHKKKQFLFDKELRNISFGHIEQIITESDEKNENQSILKLKTNHSNEVLILNNK